MCTYKMLSENATNFAKKIQPETSLVYLPNFACISTILALQCNKAVAMCAYQISP